MNIIKDNRLKQLLLLAREAYWQYKWQILALTFFGFIGGILEGVGVNALIPLFSFALGEGGGATDIISQGIERFFGLLNISFTVTYLLIFIGIIFVSKALISLFLIFLKTRIIFDYERSTRQNLFSKIVNSSWPHLIKQKLGHLETIIMVDVPVSSGLFGQLATSIQHLTGLLIYLIVAVNISLSITLATLAVGAILMLFLKPLIFRTKRISFIRTKLLKKIAHHVSENVLGVKTVKTMLAGNGVIDKAFGYFGELRDISVKLDMYKAYINTIIQPLSIIFIAVLFGFTYQSDTFNFAALIAIVYLVQKIFSYIQQMGRNIQTIYANVPHLRAVLDYKKRAEQNEEIDSGNKKFIFNKALKFENVNFRYPEGDWVIKKLNLEIGRGQLIGLIGPSGVGKTTLVDMILRLLEPTKGNIMLDGQDAASVDLSQWRKKIGYVSQDIFLTNDTIEENIRFYDKSITKKDIIEAAKMANIYKFIESTPEKFKTSVGERGQMISAGQRQRIVIARVLARKPELLILDEATSALDNESEVKIQEVIKQLRGKITVLAIAHRLSTVMGSDQLIVLGKKGICEQGTPETLLKDKKSYFSKVYNLRDN